VALIDVQMPGTDGLVALRRIQELPDPPVCAMLTTFDVDEYVVQALDLGAQGFLLKDAEPETLVRAVLDLAAGRAVLDPRVTARLLSLLRRSGAQLRSARAVTELSGRERQVLDLVAYGWSSGRRWVSWCCRIRRVLPGRRLLPWWRAARCRCVCAGRGWRCCSACGVWPASWAWHQR
jgi:hypothetical protein